MRAKCIGRPHSALPRRDAKRTTGRGYVGEIYDIGTYTKVGVWEAIGRTCRSALLVLKEFDQCSPSAPVQLLLTARLYDTDQPWRNEAASKEKASLLEKQPARSNVREEVMDVLAEEGWSISMPQSLPVHGHLYVLFPHRGRGHGGSCCHLSCQQAQIQLRATGVTNDGQHRIVIIGRPGERVNRRWLSEVAHFCCQMGK